MDYPQFVARYFPAGSGAVESACTCLVEARLKQAGMRWGVSDSQAIARLRAVQRLGRWAAFWQTHLYRQTVVDTPPLLGGSPDGLIPLANSSGGPKQANKRQPLTVLPRRLYSADESRPE